jgi:predicted PurR-regulated permease PerM
VVAAVANGVKSAQSGKGDHMTTRGYTVLGWLAWQVLKRVVKPKVADNKVKIGAAATVFAVLAAGVLAARASSSDD